MSAGVFPGLDTVLVRVTNVSSREASTFPIFSVKDATETRRLLAVRGVDVGPLVDGGAVTFFTFKDPDGNLLEACEVH